MSSASESSTPAQQLSRSSSAASSSSKSGRSGTRRSKLSRARVANSSQTRSSGLTDDEDKSLTSFPSLSPEASPAATLKQRALELAGATPTKSKPNPPARTESKAEASLKSLAAAAAAKPGPAAAKPKPPPPAKKEAEAEESKREQEEEDNDATPKRHRLSMVDTLTERRGSARTRPSLFDESPTASAHNVPGSLHHASDEQIRRLVARVGAVALVRQLAADLAVRDAELARFKWRAEARERAAKRLLREAGVGAAEVDRRWSALEREREEGGEEGGKKKRLSGGESINEMMEEAFEGSIGDGLEGEERDELDRHSTLRAIDNDAASTHSSVADERSGKAGWKDYLWGGTSRKKTSRPNSMISDRDEDAASGTSQAMARTGSGLRRRGLDDNLFKPPAESDENADAQSTSSKQDKRAVSSSWTMKLFAGNQGKEADSKSTRSRASTISTQSRREGQSAPNSSRTNLSKVKSHDSTSGNVRKAVQPLQVGPSGTVRASSSQSTPTFPAGTPMARSGSGQNQDQNLGPVEMDAILPHESRPPTLIPNQNMDESSDILTDRFGFIYDQRRRKKEADTLARLAAGRARAGKDAMGSSRDSADGENLLSSMRPTTPTSMEESAEQEAAQKPGKRWQDYLKLATFPTELLSHTPSTGSVMTLGNDDMKKSLKRSNSTIDEVLSAEEGEERASSAAPNPEPAATSISSGNAEIASPTGQTVTGTLTPAAGTGDFEPVRMLLSQLTELHDNLQRERLAKWNEFLRKVRVERRREGEAARELQQQQSQNQPSDSKNLGHQSRPSAADVPEASLADGEMIGIATLGNKGKVGRAKYKEFRQLVLGGVPVAHRAKVWAECSGAAAKKIPGYYNDLVASGIDDPTIVAQIQMDINRTLTDNVFFRRGPGVAKLNEVLLAYSRRNPEVGYCQGMNLITASLLLIMPTAEDAFWMLTSLIEQMLPRHYYDKSLLASRADQAVLRGFVAQLLPKLSAHLDDLGVELDALTFQWFLSLFTDCLSAEALYRVWDVLLCLKDDEANGGSTFLFQVALALLKLNEPQLLACQAPGEVYAYLGGEITDHAISIDGLIKASDGLRGYVKRPDVEARRAEMVKEELERIKERERIRNEVEEGAKNKKAKKKAAAAEEGLDSREPMPVES